MRLGNYGNLGNVGNVKSATCRRHYPGDGTNPALCGWPVRYLKKIENRHDRGRMKAALPVILRPHPNQTANATGDPVDRKLGEYAMRQASCHDPNDHSKSNPFCSSCSSFLQCADIFRNCKIITACLPRACTMPFCPFCLDWPIMFCVSCGRDDRRKRTNPSSSVVNDN